VPNSALEQAASAARPWQKAHRMFAGSGGPRSVPRPPLLTAGVMSQGHGVREALSLVWRQAMRWFCLVLLLTIGGQVLTSTPCAAGQFRVLITDSAFIPQAVFCIAGDTLRWVNATASPQTITTGSLCEPWGPLDLGDIAAGDSVMYAIDFGGTGEVYSYFSRHNCPGPDGALYVGPDLPAHPTTWGSIRGLYQ
jgi:hypothetical protein